VARIWAKESPKMTTVVNIWICHIKQLRSAYPTCW